MYTWTSLSILPLLFHFYHNPPPPPPPPPFHMSPVNRKRGKHALRIVVLTHSPSIPSLTSPPLHPLFAAQSIVIARCSVFHFNSHLMARSSTLRSPFSSLPLTSVFLLHLSSVRRFLVILFGISSVAPSSCSLFSSLFSLACRFLPNVPHTLNQSHP